MNDKRFIYDGLYIRDLHGKIPPILTDNDKLIDKYLKELNGLHDENNYLKTLKWNQDCITEISVCHQIKESLEAENSILVKENKLLKTELDYIQNSITEHIKHQKTELGQKALKEIIEDYNEWMLGHKELEE